jgi:hypothetical protein
MVPATFVMVSLLKNAGREPGYRQYSAGTGILILVLFPFMVSRPGVAELLLHVLVGIVLSVE